MFFMMGITQGQKDLDFNQTIICDHCGGYGRYQVYMTYMVLSLFFIPVFKWSKKYYVKTTCCNTIYELQPEIGKCVARGEIRELLPHHMTKVQSGYKNRYRRCSSCGYETQEDFEFCPKCGRRFE